MVKPQKVNCIERVELIDFAFVGPSERLPTASLHIEAVTQPIELFELLRIGRTIVLIDDEQHDKNPGFPAREGSLSAACVALGQPALLTVHRCRRRVA